MTKKKVYVYQGISRWLFICYIFCLIIASLGASTRLTDSGLSITHWGVFKGTIFPITDKEWMNEFNLYKDSLEYKIRYKKDMSLSQFKSIFWLEYFHRLFARVLAGFVFVFPFIYFLLKGVLSFKGIFKIFFAFILGFIQGVVGWIMVKTGLNEQTAYIFGNQVRVNPVNLVVHLNFAIFLMLYLFHLFLYFRDKSQLEKVLAIEKNKELLYFKKYFIILFILIMFTITFGGLVAGLKAGLFYQSFPLMNGYVFPPDLFHLSPTYVNFIQNQTTVQFFHRLFAISTFLFSLFFSIYGYQKKIFNQPKVFPILYLAIVCFQISLGIVGLLNFQLRGLYTIIFGVIHQIIAIILVTIVYYSYYRIFRFKKIR